MSPPTPRRAWLIFGLGVTAYAVAVFQRASLGVAGVEAQHRFHTTAAVLSLFSVLQLAVYAGLQIPVGVVLDRVGPRRLVAAGARDDGGRASSCSPPRTPCRWRSPAGCMVGAGDAMTFISVLRLVAAWFPPQRVPLLTQLTGILGQLGQIVAAYPLVALLQGAGLEHRVPDRRRGRRVVVGVSAVLRCATRRPGHRGRGARSAAGRRSGRLGHAWREPGTRLGLWTHFVTQFSGTVFALLWGYPFLVVGEHRSPAEAGVLITLLVLVAMVVGPVLGHLAGRWPYRRSVPVLAILGSTVGDLDGRAAWPGRAPLALLVVLVVVLASNGPGLADGLRLRPDRERGRADRLGDRHRQRRRLRRLADDDRADRHRPQRPEQRRPDELHARRLPPRLLRPVPVLGAWG